MVDPASPFVERAPEMPAVNENPQGTPRDTRIDIGQLLKTQLTLTNRLQQQLLDGGLNSLPPREVKEILTTVSSMLTLAHRTDEVSRELETYKLIVEVVFAWVKKRADSTGEDLLAELRAVAATMRNSDGITADRFI